MSSLNRPRFWLHHIGLLAPLLCLAGTVAVYSTALNPGLPLLLANALAALFCAWRLLSSRRPFYHPGLDILLALALWAALSATTALDPYLAQRSLATGVGGCGLTLGLVVAIRSSRDWKLAAYGLVGFTALASIAAWPAAFAVARQTGHLPALTGTYNNPDAFSILPLSGFCLGFGLLARRRGAGTGLMLALLGVLALSLAATGCRSALLGATLGLGLSFALMATHRSRRLAKARPLMMALPIVVVMALLPLSNFGLSGLDKISRTFNDAALRNEATRLEVAYYGWRAVAQHAVLGAGPGCFGLAYQTVRPDPHPDDYINLAHNDHIEMAVELGFPGLLLWAAALAAAAHKAYDGLLHGRRPAEAAGLLAALAALIVFAFFNFIVSERPSFWVQCYLLGLAYAFPSERSARPEPKLARLLLTLPLLALALWGVTFAARLLQADSYAATARGQAEGLLFESSAGAWDQAIALQPERAAFRQSRAEVARKLATLGVYSEAPVVERQLRSALLASPANTGVMVQLALWLAQRGETKEAKALLDQASRLAPGSPMLKRRRQELAVGQGRWAEAAAQAWAAYKTTGQGLTSLAELVIAAELANPGAGCALLREWTRTPNERSSLLWQELFRQTETRKLGAPRLSFALLRVELSPTDLCAKLALAQAAAQGPGGVEQQFQILGKALAEASLTTDRSPCLEPALLLWTSRAVDRGQVAAAQERLGGILQDQPRLHRVRLRLADLLAVQGQRAEATALLKDGLSFDNSSVDLHLGLARLYRAGGSADLARAYARDALRLDPTSQEAKSLLK